MNCHEFEDIVTDLARTQILEAGAREAALSHAGSCARCAARLAAQQALTEDLRILGVRADTELARVEESLRAAFRRRPSGPRWAWAWVAAAAVVLLAQAGIRTEWWRQRTAARPVPAVVRTPPPAEPPSVVPATTPPQRIAVTPRRAVPREREIRTDFLPLLEGDDFTPLDGSQMVRVRLPGSALASLGLPVSETRAREPIHADVLLGEDGLAHAVRFIKKERIIP